MRSVWSSLPSFSIIVIFGCSIVLDARAADAPEFMDENNPPLPPVIKPLEIEATISENGAHWQAREDMVRQKRKDEELRKKRNKQAAERWQKVLDKFEKFLSADNVRVHARLIESTEDTFSLDKEKTNERLYGSKILAECDVEKDDRKATTDTLFNLSNYGSPGANCFWPGLQLEFVNGSESVEVLVCLECRWIRLCHQKKPESRALNLDGIEAFGAIFKRLFPQTAEQIDSLVASKKNAGKAKSR